MLTITLLLLNFWAWLAPLPLNEDPASNPSLTIKVSNLRNRDGKLLIALYNNEASFEAQDGKHALRKTSLLAAGSTTCTFKNLKPGIYAIGIVHDENNNKKLDKNLLGIPKEGVGVSNGFKSKLRQPTFKESSFQLSKELKVVTIETIYF